MSIDSSFCFPPSNVVHGGDVGATLECIVSSRLVGGRLRGPVWLSV